MEIIKPGNIEFLRKIKNFKCLYCGCEFKADKNEYENWGSWRNLQCYLSKCPTCGSAVYTEE